MVEEHPPLAMKDSKLPEQMLAVEDASSALGKAMTET